MATVQAIICPSILSADFGNLGAECRRMMECGADWLHVDSMDGHFVPNLTIGAPVVKSLRKHTAGAFLDCHCMVSNPEQWVDDFAAAGADQYTFHAEATADATSLISKIKSKGMKAGIAISPDTPFEKIVEIAPQCDLLLVMSVYPGFGGQKFMPSVLPKIRELRQRFPNVNIQIDGGITLDNIAEAAAAGANVIVAGTSIFGAADPKAAIQGLRDVVNQAFAAAAAQASEDL